MNVSDDAVIANDKEAPLSGLRIIDLSRVLSGPASTMLLSDQGADVIKIEPPQGDITRRMGVGENGMTSGFLNINRGKRSLALDLKSKEGLEIVKKLLVEADVFVQNFRPGAIEALGLSENEVRQISPEIIYVSISGFGRGGPYSDKRVYDPVIQALSGITDIQAESSTGRPQMIRTVIPDKTTALTTAQAITAALYFREKTGRGKRIDVAMLDAMIAYIWPEGMINLTLVDKKRDLRVGQIAQDLIFATSDGYITAGAMSDDEWMGMCKALDKPEWKTDPRFKDTAARFINARERLSGTAEIIRKASTEYWLKRLEVNGVPCAPVLTRAEMLDNEQVVHNKIVQEYDHPEIGRVRGVRPAAQFDGYVNNPAPLAPLLGEHNKEILLSVGYTEEQIEELYDGRILVDSKRK